MVPVPLVLQLVNIYCPCFLWWCKAPLYITKGMNYSGLFLLLFLLCVFFNDKSKDKFVEIVMVCFFRIEAIFVLACLPHSRSLLHDIFSHRSSESHLSTELLSLDFYESLPEQNQPCCEQVQWRWSYICPLHIPD